MTESKSQTQYLWSKIAEMEQRQLKYLIELTEPKPAEPSLAGWFALSPAERNAKAHTRPIEMDTLDFTHCSYPSTTPAQS